MLRGRGRHFHFSPALLLFGFYLLRTPLGHCNDLLSPSARLRLSSSLGLGTGTRLMENLSPSERRMQNAASPVSYWWQLPLLSFIKASFCCFAKQSCCKGYRWKWGKEVNAIYVIPCLQGYLFFFLLSHCWNKCHQRMFTNAAWVL